MDTTDIKVYLSSTKYLVSALESKLKKLDVPVCSAIMRLDKPAKKIDKKYMKQRCRDLARYVHVDVEKKYFIISEIYNNSAHALIEYDIKNSNEYGEQFLKRWVETEMMMLEFNLYGKKDKYIFTLRGLWDDMMKDWVSLKFEKIRSIIVTDQKISETIISKGE